MGARTVQATDVFAELERTPAPRTDTPKEVGTDLPGESASGQPHTNHQDAAVQLAAHLDPTSGLTPRQRADNFLTRRVPQSIEAP